MHNGQPTDLMTNALTRLITQCEERAVLLAVARAALLDALVSGSPARAFGALERITACEADLARSRNEFEALQARGLR